uniref:Uncharacterized protein n=1 Tax=Caenorhabditis japonica TaxID=281687 RepID=A0A8R1I598_CAEJA
MQSVFHVLMIFLALYLAASHAAPTPFASRESRALAPSVESWCIFYPEKCRMLKFAGIRKRNALDVFDY